MSTKVKTKSRLLEAAHETAQDLYRLGFIDKRKMSIAPVADFDSVKIRDLRQSLQLSQAVLAAVLNTSISTIRKWELGDKHPSGPSLKLLSLLERKGLEAVL
jgi:putative transcriptional regulator